MAKQRDYSYYANAYNNKFSNDYGSFTNQVDFTGGFIPSFSSSYDMQPHYNAYQEAVARSLRENTPRSLLDRTFDTLLAGQYAVVGGLRGAVRPDMTVGEGIMSGLKAANPFGKGYEEGEHSVSLLLEDMGWKPESTFGKIAKGTVGFVGDVLLDPLTYATFGTSAALKGTGVGVSRIAKAATAERIGKRFGIEVTEETIEDLPNQVYESAFNTLKERYGTRVSEKSIRRLAQKRADEAKQALDASSKKMTVETAEYLIRNQLEKRGAKIDETQIKRDAVDYTTQYNRLLGYREKGQGITFGMANLPFAKETLGRATLVADDAIRRFSDETGIADLYTHFRDAFYQSGLGEKLSPKSALYRLAIKDPHGFYDVINAHNYTKGLKMDLLQKKKIIQERSKYFNTLTPAEQKQVLEALEDRSMWQPLTHFASLWQAGRKADLEKELHAERTRIDKEMSGLRAENEKIDSDILRYSNEIKNNISALEKLKERYRKSMIKFDLDAEQAKREAEQVPSPDDLVDPIPEFNRQTKNDYARATREYKKAVKEIEKENEELQKKLASLTQKKKVLVEDGLDADFVTNLQDEFLYMRHLNAIRQDFFDEAGNFRSTNQADEAFREGQTLHESFDDVLNRLASFTKKASDEIAHDLKVNATRTNKQKIINMINDELSPGKPIVSSSMTDEALEYLIERMSDPHITKTELVQEILSDASFFQGLRRQAYSFIAKRLGYTRWADVHPDMKKELTPVRNRLVDFLTSANTPEEFRERLRQVMERDLHDLVRDIDVNASKLLKRDADEVRRDQFNQEDFADARYYEGFTRDADDNLQSTVLEREMRQGTQSNQFVDRTPDNVIFDEKDRNLVRHWAVQNEKALDGKAFGELTDVQKKRIDMVISTMERVLNGRIRFTDVDLEDTARTYIGKNFFHLQPDEKRTVYILAKKHVSQQVKLAKGGKKANVIDNATARDMAKRDLLKPKDELAEVQAKLAANQKRLTDLETSFKEQRKQAIQEAATRRADLRASYLAEKEKVLRQLERGEGVAAKYSAEKRAELVDMWKERIKQQTETISKLTKLTHKELKDIQNNNFEKMAEYREEKRVLEAALTDELAFENYFTAKYGNEWVREQKTRDVGEIYLDSRMDMSDKVKEIAKSLKALMQEMAEGEVKIGKLKEEQIIDTYLPHILTLDGKRLFLGDKEIVEKRASITQDMGYGQEWNPHRRQRSVRIKLEDGSEILNPTIKQLNDHFRSELNGKDAYVEAIADLYLARANKHVDLMYDHEYMQNMLNAFGDKIDYKEGIKEGYKAVMNFGKLREFGIQSAAIQTALQISDDISSYLRDLMPVLGKRYGGRVPKDVMTRVVSDYMERNYPKATIDEVFKSHAEDFLSKVGISSSTMDDMATPMVELSVDQAKAIEEYHAITRARYDTLRRHRKENMEKYGFDEKDIARYNKMVERLEKYTEPMVRQVNDVIVMRANQARQAQLLRDQNDMLKMYDKFLHIMKLNMTTVTPAFHIRNKMANMFLNWLGVGGDALGWEVQSKAYKAIRNKGSYEKPDMLRITRADGVEDVMNMSDVYLHAKALGVVDEGFFAADIGAGSQTKGLLKGRATFQTKGGRTINLDPTDSENFALYKTGGKIGNFVENMDRLANFMAHLRKGKSPEEAASLTNTFLFNYSDLTAFEQNVMKRLIPFYTWLRKNSALQVRELIEQPEKFHMVAKTLTAIENSNNEEDLLRAEDIAPWAQDWVQMPWSVPGRFGKEEPVLFNPNMPFGDINRIPNPMDIGGSIGNLISQSTPALKVPLEQALNTNLFLNNRIVGDGESQFNRVDHLGSQFALYNILKGFVNKSGVDEGLHGVNTFGGVKMVGYDKDGYNYYKNIDNSGSGILGAIRRFLSGNQ